MHASLRQGAIGSMIVVAAGLGLIACGTPDYTMEDVETCGEILGKESPVEMEVSGVEFVMHGEFREHAVTKYYIVTREHGQMEVDFEEYALNNEGDIYCTTERTRVPKG